MTTEPHTGGPARGYSWPPFAPGNRLSMTHGAYSPEVVGQEASAILDELSEFMPPWLMLVDQFELAAWATAEGRCRRLRKWLTEHGDLDDGGRPRPANDLLLRWERRAADARKRLGFDPLARAQLARDRAAAGLFTAQGQHLAGADRLVQEGEALAAERVAGALPDRAEGSDDADD